jgi:hypothetical protein
VGAGLVVAGKLTDAEHEIFTNELDALLHRAELRDLVDLRELLAKGADLARGLRDAASKDGGFSPLMVGHLLQAFPVAKQAAAARMAADETARLEQFRADLMAQIAALTRP